MSMRNPALVALPLCTVLLACAKQAPPAEQASREWAVPAPSTFTVDVRLLDGGKPQFDRSGETIIVSARYYGEPVDDVAASAVNDVGQVDLGSAEVELVGEGLARFDGSALLRSRRTLVQGEPQLEISVFSGRRTSPDNLLDCDAFQGALSDAVRAPIRVDCRLLPGAEDAAPQV